MGNKLLILSLTLFIGFSATAQKRIELNNSEQIVLAAVTNLDKYVNSQKFKDFTSSNGISGTYLFEVSIRNKGEVVSVRALEREGDIPSQNALKDFLKAYNFPFKLPKGSTYKFNYKFENL